MRIRKFKKEDAAEVARLHRLTIRHINRKDYPPEQIAAWSGRVSAKRCRDSMGKLTRFVAVERDKIIGFGDYKKDGELTGLYVHKKYLRKGVGKALLQRMEKQAYQDGLIKLHAHSTITAKKFYDQQGYQTLRKTKHGMEGHKLIVYSMEKKLRGCG